MNRRIFLTAIVACLATACLAVPAELLAQVPSFTGQYIGAVTKPGGPPPPSLRVMQNASKIDIVRVDRGVVSKNSFILNGPEGTYISPAGLHGKGQAKLEGDYLLIQSIVENKPQPSSPPIQVRIRERWQLAPDRKALQIDFSVDFPGLKGAPAQTWTEAFTRAPRL